MPAPGKLTIETPEQVSLDFALASVGSRFLALALDTLLQASAIAAVILSALAVLVGAGLTWRGIGTWVEAIAVLALFALYYGYFAAFETLWAGQTPGKRLVGLRVLSVTGRPVTPSETILRNVVRIADQLPGIYAVGILFVLVTGRNQRLGDLAAGTVVVHERPLAPRPDDQPADRSVRVRHGAHRLAPEEVAVIETFLRRRSDLSAEARLRAARQIAARIQGRLDVASIGDEEAFLEEINGEYRAGRYR